MLFYFTKPVQINFKPVDVKKFSYNRASFKKGQADVSDEVMAAPYFKTLVLSGVVREIGTKSLDVLGISAEQKNKVKQKQRQVSKVASSASVPEGFELQDTDAIVANIGKQ